MPSDCTPVISHLLSLYPTFFSLFIPFLYLFKYITLSLKLLCLFLMFFFFICIYSHLINFFFAVILLYIMTILYLFLHGSSSLTPIHLFSHIISPGYHVHLSATNSSRSFLSDQQPPIVHGGCQMSCCHGNHAELSEVSC